MRFPLPCGNLLQFAIEAMVPVEIVDNYPAINGGSFQSYVSHYQSYENPHYGRPWKKWNPHGLVTMKSIIGYKYL